MKVGGLCCCSEPQTIGLGCMLCPYKSGGKTLCSKSNSASLIVMFMSQKESVAWENIILRVLTSQSCGIFNSLLFFSSKFLNQYMQHICAKRLEQF